MTRATAARRCGRRQVSRRGVGARRARVVPGAAGTAVRAGTRSAIFHCAAGSRAECAHVRFAARNAAVAEAVFPGQAYGDSR